MSRAAWRCCGETVGGEGGIEAYDGPVEEEGEADPEEIGDFKPAGGVGELPKADDEGENGTPECDVFHQRPVRTAELEEERAPEKMQYPIGTEINCDLRPLRSG